MGLHKGAGITKGRQCWALVAVISGIAILLQAGGNPVRDMLAYTRVDVASGEFWRLLSGHFVHLGWPHMWLNLAGLALVAWLVGKAFDWLRWLAVGLITLVTIDAGFWWLYPSLGWYVGLSGLLHGLLVAGLYRGIRQRDKESIVLICFVVAKLAWEQFSGGPLPGSEATSGGTVIVNAHLYGAVGGALAGLVLLRRAEPSRAI